MHVPVVFQLDSSGSKDSGGTSTNSALCKHCVLILFLYPSLVRSTYAIAIFVSCTRSIRIRKGAKKKKGQSQGFWILFGSTRISTQKFLASSVQTFMHNVRIGTKMRCKYIGYSICQAQEFFAPTESQSSYIKTIGWDGQYVKQWPLATKRGIKRLVEHRPCLRCWNQPDGILFHRLGAIVVGSSC